MLDGPELLKAIAHWRDTVFRVFNEIDTYRDAIRDGHTPRDVAIGCDTLDSLTNSLATALPTITANHHEMPIEPQHVEAVGRAYVRWMKSATPAITPDHGELKEATDRAFCTLWSAEQSLRPAPAKESLPPVWAAAIENDPAVAMMLDARNQLNQLVLSRETLGCIGIEMNYCKLFHEAENAIDFAVGGMERTYRDGPDPHPFILIGSTPESTRNALATILEPLVPLIADTMKLESKSDLNKLQPYQHSIDYHPLGQWLHWLFQLGNRFDHPGIKVLCGASIYNPGALLFRPGSPWTPPQTINLPGGFSIARHVYDRPGDPQLNPHFQPLYDELLSGRIEKIEYVENVVSASKYAVELLIRMYTAFCTTPDAGLTTGDAAEGEPESTATMNASLRPAIKPAWNLAWQAYEIAKQQSGNPLNYREAHAWLKEKGPEEYQLPKVGTFQDYCSKYASATNPGANTPRAGREGRNVVRRDQI